MTGTMYFLDTTQAVFTILVIAMIALIVYCAVQGIDLEHTEHYVVKVSTYDDNTLLQPSWARITCACGKVIHVIADDFLNSDACEAAALTQFTHHQTKESISGN